MNRAEAATPKNLPPQTSFPGASLPPLPEVKGFIETSFIDWPGRLCSVLFLGGCNFRCPFCHNHPLVLEPQTFAAIPFADVLKRLTPMRRWLGGICISGGEPTLDAGLPAMLTLLKKQGWAIKLDTNGTRPPVLRRLLKAGLVDMISMDVKAPLKQDKYDRCAGISVALDQIAESISLIRKSGIDHEFRMTVLPKFHSQTDIAKWKAALGNTSRLKLQNFNPKTTLKPELMKEQGFPPEIFNSLKACIA